MAHSTLEQPRSLYLSTGNGPFHCGTAQSVSDRNGPFHCATDPYCFRTLPLPLWNCPVLFQGIAPFNWEWPIPLWNCPVLFQGIAPSTVELSSAISGHCPFQIGTAHSTVLGYCPFQLCFRILPLSLLFQDIAPLNSVSGYCPFELCFRISPF